VHYGYLIRRSPFRRVPAARPCSAPFLQLKYGTALEQIKEVFFSLEDSRREPIFNTYAERYGLAAGLNARRAYRRWKTGDLTLSGPALTRLIEVLPQFMSDFEQLELLKRLQRESAKQASKANLRFRIRKHRDLASAVSAISKLSREVGPERFEYTFEELSEWLRTDELHGLKCLAGESEREASAERFIDLLARLSSLRLLRQLESKRFAIDVEARFESPTVEATLKFARSYWRSMESDDDLLVRLQELALKQEQQGGGLSYVDYVMRTLTPEEQTRLRAIAAAEGLKTEILLKELQVKTLAARGDIQSVIDTAEQLKAKKHQSKISSEHATASGVTKIEIENRRRFSCGWVLLVLGSVTGFIVMLVASLVR